MVSILVLTLTCAAPAFTGRGLALLTRLVDQYFFKEARANRTASYFPVLLQSQMNSAAFRRVQAGDNLGFTVLPHLGRKLGGLLLQAGKPLFPISRRIQAEGGPLRQVSANHLAQQILQAVEDFAILAGQVGLMLAADAAQNGVVSELNHHSGRQAHEPKQVFEFILNDCQTLRRWSGTGFFFYTGRLLCNSRLGFSRNRRWQGYTIFSRFCCYSFSGGSFPWRANATLAFVLFLFFLLPGLR